MIRFATLNDVDELSKLISDVILNCPYYTNSAKEYEVKIHTNSGLSDQIIDDKYSVIVAEEDNKLVGFCISLFNYFTIYASWVGVSEFNGKEFLVPLGRALVQYK